MGARFLPGLSCPCLVWKRRRCGVRKSYKVTVWCWGLVRALATLCCGVHTVERLSNPTPAQGERTEPIFHLAGVISVCTALCCASLSAT